MTDETSQPTESSVRRGMFCSFCGIQAVRRIELADEQGVFRCTNCGDTTVRNVLPMVVVTGASGVGKSSVIQPLQTKLTDYVVLDKDAMWSASWEQAYNNFFRIASAVAQAERVTVVVGTILPEMVDTLSDRDLVGAIHYANLHCNDETREQRLLARRTWDIPDSGFIAEHQQFARWLVEHAETDFTPPMPMFETATDPPEVIADRLAEWVRGRMAAPPGIR